MERKQQQDDRNRTRGYGDRDGYNHGNKGYGNGGNYNNRDNRDNKGGRKDDRGGNNQPKYQEKGKKNDRDGKNDKFNEKGGRGDKSGKGRNDDKKQEREIIPIDDDEMGEIIKKNFEEFVLKTENDAAEAENQDPEEENKKEKKEKFDAYVYRKLSNENGKRGDAMFFSLLCNVFDEDIGRVEKNFFKYIQTLVE